MSESTTLAEGHVNPACDDDGCYCPDDAFWGRLLGDADPCAPGKDWVAAAFGPLDDAPAPSPSPDLTEATDRGEGQ